MPINNRKIRNKICTASIMLACAFLLSACGKSETLYLGAEATEIVDTSIDADKIRISEYMSKNRGTLRDENGNFSDWIELENYSAETVDLSGWSISDSENPEGWKIPDVKLAAGERIVLYADGKDKDLHTDFSLSEDEGLWLYNAYGHLASHSPAVATEADVSVALSENGGYEQSLYPTPGLENSFENYVRWQTSRLVPGPLQINRVAVANQSDELYGADWVEIKNISAEPVELSNYYLSDDYKDYKLWQFPDYTLYAGQSLIVCCDEELIDSSLIIAPFGLDSANDQLYLSTKDYELIDYVSLKNIPYDCSYGRLSGQDGWFYLYGSAPSDAVQKGYRKVSESPVALYADGVFDGVISVEVGFEGKGTIYYTVDSSMPTESSATYKGEFSLEETGIVRAIAVEEGAMPSRALTLSYIINENHSLPVLSLVSDSSYEFNRMYSNAIKNLELPGNLALYDGKEGFSIACGIKMHGDTSLILPKKNMSVRFRGSYGQEELNYDVYGGGVTKFSNFVLRAGQDYYHAIIRNELGQNLALASSDSLISQRSKYCVLYVDGKYSGIYNLMEKANEQHYANIAGVSRESVVVEEAYFGNDSLIYKEVFEFCTQNDMSLPENYEKLCSVLDVDNLIDWIILQGFCANTDLQSGNLRYCKSIENDGKWRLIFYDLDSSFSSYGSIFYNVLINRAERRYSSLITPLLENQQFVDQLLSRTAELLATTLSTESVHAEIDRLVETIAPEVERDIKRVGRSYYDWTGSVDALRVYVDKWCTAEKNVEIIRDILHLSKEDKAHYFGEVLK